MTLDKLADIACKGLIILVSIGGLIVTVYNLFYVS